MMIDLRSPEWSPAVTRSLPLPVLYLCAVRILTPMQEGHDVVPLTTTLLWLCATAYLNCVVAKAPNPREVTRPPAVS
jgi:hypothetical protein